MAKNNNTQTETAAKASVRVIISVGLGIVAGVIIGLTISWKYAPLAAWDSAALIFLIWISYTLNGRDAEQTKTLATREDPSHAASDIVLVCASIISLVAVAFLLVQVNSEKGAASFLLAAVCILSVVISWATIHTVFTLRYAREFYNDTDSIGFNDKKLPRYSDFLYLSFTVGMTFQVSDTQIKSNTLRKIILRQALLSYAFGTIIVAITINLIASLGK